MNYTERNRQVMARDGWQCPHCGTSNTLTIQHRRSRGMGGSRSRDGYENVIALCQAFNALIEQDSGAAAEAIAKGWKIRQDDPRTAETIPALGYDGWRLLFSEGGYMYCDGPEAAS